LPFDFKLNIYQQLPTEDDMTDTHDDIVQGLIQAAHDDNHLVRSAAVRALGRAKAPDAIPILLLALRDKAGFVYDFAVGALSGMDDPTIPPAMLERLQDNDSEVRRAAATVLGARRFQPSVQPLIAALKDEALEVGYAAAQALGEIGDTAAVPALVEALENPHSDWPMCINAAQALGSIGDASAAPALIGVFRRRWEPVPGMNTTPPVRKNVLEALVKLGDSVVPDLLTALQDDDVKVRHGAVEALGHIAARDE
jgi:HEAT repeat protein